MFGPIQKGDEISIETIYKSNSVLQCFCSEGIISVSACSFSLTTNRKLIERIIYVHVM